MIGLIHSFLLTVVLLFQGTSYLGYNTVGGTLTSFGGNDLRAVGPFTAPGNGTATRIELYTNSVGNNGTLGLFANGSSYPAALLRQTAGGALNGGSGTDDWRGQDLTSPYNITGGTAYWVVFYFSAAQDINYDVTSPGHYLISQTYVDGVLPNPFTASATANGATISVRVVYTPAGGGGVHSKFLMIP